MKKQTMIEFPGGGAPENSSLKAFWLGLLNVILSEIKNLIPQKSKSFYDNIQKLCPAQTSSYSCVVLTKSSSSDFNEIIRSVQNDGQDIQKVPCRKFAFTLAEVLISLGIIGIVAAMTLPGILKKTENKILVNQYKVFYSDFLNSINLFMEQNGCQSWQDTPMADDKLSIEQKTDYFIDNVLKKYLGGAENDIKIKYKYLNHDGIIRTQKYSFITTKGAVLSIENGLWNSNFTVYFDINGKKGPNRAGLDTFRFYFYKDSIPKSAYENPKDWDCSNCGDSCRPDLHPSAAGWGCWNRIIQDGWEIKYR